MLNTKRHVIKTSAGLSTGFALEQPVHFLTEQRIEPYREYDERAAEVKNVLVAKNTLKRRVLLDLEGCGA